MFFVIQADRLPGEKVETPASTLAEVNTKALFKTLPNMVAVVKVETLADKMANVEAKALVDTLADTLPEIEMQTLARHWLRCRPRR